MEPVKEQISDKMVGTNVNDLIQQAGEVDFKEDPRVLLNSHPAREFMELLISYADEVFADLGSGFSESIYHKAYEVHLREKNIPYETEITVPIDYHGYNVGYGKPDIIIRRSKDRTRVIVIEFKAVVNEPRIQEVAQVKTYMGALGIKYGLIINFPQPGSYHRSTKSSVDFLPVTLE